MKALDTQTLEWLWHDADAREVRLRALIPECLAASPPPVIEGQIVATYFLALRTMTLAAAAKEISYHATSGIKDPPPGSLLEECTATTVVIDAFDASQRIGLLQMAFPLKMLLHPDGGITTTDILHTVAGPTIFDVYERQDARLVSLQLPGNVIRAFPGPAHGPEGFRAMARLSPEQPAFGTILKPTAGITPEQVGTLVEQGARCPLLTFVKEDENLYPDLDYSPVSERVRQAEAAIARVRDSRNNPGLVFAPHITAAPHQMLDVLNAALDAGARGVMFSEMFAEGLVRMVREATKHRDSPPVIYGHNAGIGVKSRCIWREVIDLLARLDGIDFRQTAPVSPGQPFLRPYGQEWLASEHVLSMPIEGIKPVTIVRAGALDQGNIAMNLADADRRGISRGVLFLAGSAINSIRNERGKADPAVGAQAMVEAVELHREGVLRDVPIEQHVSVLKDLARGRRLKALSLALSQRYPDAGG
jgi:ribulose 1,5-bisphosphate carboxylase large subunit-like protein